MFMRKVFLQVKFYHMHVCCNRMITFIIHPVNCLSDINLVFRKSFYTNFVDYNSNAGSLKKFTSLENDFYHDILASKSTYKNTIAFVDLNEETFMETASTIFDKDFNAETVYNLRRYLQILLTSKDDIKLDIFSNRKFENLCKTLESKLNDLNDDHLILLLKTLYCWPKIEKYKDLYFDLCKGADSLCFQRYRMWSHDRKLLVMDYFYRLGVIRYSEFAWSAVRYSFKKVSIMSPNSMVQLMFIVNTLRKWHPAINMYEVEYALEESINDLSLEEVGIIVYAFFKTQTRITSQELMEKIYLKLEKRLQLNEIHPILLTSFLKLFRFSTRYSLAHRVRDLTNYLVPYIENLNIQSCVHCALLGTQLFVFHPELLKRVAQSLVDNIHEARLKDIERILFSIALFNFDPKTKPCMFETAIQELKSERLKEEISLYPRSYTSALSYLAIKQIYDHDCVNKAFSKEMMTVNGKPINKFLVTRDMLVLANSIELEYPSYTGNKMDAELRKTCCKFIAWKTPQDKDFQVGRYTGVYIDCKKNLQNMYGGSNYVHPCFVLPHFSRTDILICLKDGIPKEIPEHMKVIAFENMVPPPDIGTWYCFCILCRNLTISGTNDPVGSCVAKFRQLRILNYKPVIILRSEWMKLKSDVQKEKYLENLIKSS